MRRLVQGSQISLVKIPDGQAQEHSFDGLERPLYKNRLEVRIISKFPFPMPYFGRIDTWYWPFFFQ
jgi:hypothetical protein